MRDCVQKRYAHEQTNSHLSMQEEKNIFPKTKVKSMMIIQTNLAQKRHFVFSLFFFSRPSVHHSHMRATRKYTLLSAQSYACNPKVFFQ